MKTKILPVLVALLIPIVTFAQPQTVTVTAPGQGIVNLIVAVDRIVRMLVPILIVLAIIAFFWGLVKYIWGQGKDSTTGRNTMIAGLASLFVMVTLWGILAFAANALGIQNGFNNNSPLNPPRVNGQ